MKSIEDVYADHLGPAILADGGPLFRVLVAVVAGAHRQAHQLLTGSPLVAAFDGRFGAEWTKQWRAGGGRPTTPTALIEAVRATLASSKRVQLVERDGGDHKAVRVQVYSSEVIDLDATTQAAQEQVSDGLLLTVEVLIGATVQHMRDFHGPTVADYAARFATVRDARDHVPE